MNIKTICCSALAALFLISCDEDTSSLGGSITPKGDNISVTSDSCFATSRTILSSDSLLVMTQQYNLGRFTEQNSGATFESSFITQLNCPENYSLPDSAYGIGNHKFPQWFIDTVGTQKPYYANLRMYYQGYFGDSTNTIKIDVFPLSKMLEYDNRFYPSIDPAQYCNLDAEPLASMTVSAWNLQSSDSILAIETHYPDIIIRLPDSVATRILKTYYSPEGRKYFADSKTFMENLYKGFYIRCSQGDGTILYIDRVVLEVNIKTVGKSEDTGEPTYRSIFAEFNGNAEVMQFNCIKWSGLEEELADTSCTWIRSPFGVLTEITLPVDKMKEGGSVLNAAQLCLSSAITPSSRFKPSAPSIIALIRKDQVQKFFSKNNNVDNTESFVAAYSSKLGTYTYGNLAPLVEKIYSDRDEWLQANGMKLDESGRQAYANARPDWDKVVLVPVSGVLSSTSTVSRYELDMKLHQVKLLGGSKAIKIKTIKSKF